jgi:hypothetical protein
MNTDDSYTEGPPRGKYDLVCLRPHSAAMERSSTCIGYRLRSSGYTRVTKTMSNIYESMASSDSVRSNLCTGLS